MAADLLKEKLSPPWQYSVTSDGRVFFISDEHRITTWLHPVTNRPVQTGHQAAPGLPNGWEQDYTPEGALYFIDHNQHLTTFSHPVTGKPVSEEDPPLPPSSPPLSPTERPAGFKRGTPKQRSVKAPSAKRNPGSVVVKEGFLYRLESGGISKTWKKRWCVLSDYALFLYKDNGKPLGSILLPSYRVNPCSASDPVDKELSFKVEHENTKTEYFYVDSLSNVSNFTEWLYALQDASLMKGSIGKTGFVRETNVIRQLPERPPQYSEFTEEVPSPVGSSDTNPDMHFESHWHNPNSHHSLDFEGDSPTYHQNGHAKPPGMVPKKQPWQSYPNLGGEQFNLRTNTREMDYDPRGSLRSLPQEVHRNRQDFPYSSEQGNLDKPVDPRLSLRSLPGEFYRNSDDFSPTSPVSNLIRERGLSSHTNFGPPVKPDNSQQRLYTGRDDPKSYHSGPYNSSHKDSNREDTHPGLRGSSSGSPMLGSRSFGPENSHNRNYTQDINFPSRNGDFVSGDRPHSEQDGRLLQDPRASYASSGRHSFVGQSYSPNGQGSKQNLYPSEGSLQGSRSSISRPYPSSRPLSQTFQPSPDSLGHIYMNLPDVQHSGLETTNTPGRSPYPPAETMNAPGRPPYPSAVRGQLVKELADNHSPVTAERMMTAHNLNKERMQQMPYFQYPPSPNTQQRGREALPYDRISSSVRQPSQYSPNQPDGGQDPRQMPPVSYPNDRRQGSNSGSSMDGGRRQDSGSGRFSDSFDRSSPDVRLNKPDGKQKPSLEYVLNPSVRDERNLPEKDLAGNPEAKSLRQAYERVQSFRQSKYEDSRGPKRPILTVREEQDMPESEVLETKPTKKHPLNGVRLRMSISAGDLIGKTHDELVLLLIQLRRNQAGLEKARDFYRERLSKRRPVEREYRKQRHDSVGKLERSLEEGHQSFVDIRSRMEEVEKKLEVYRPLINLVDNMVTMGSLYGGDNLMLATQYRKHLLRPEQYQTPRKLLEFSRQYQEEKVFASKEAEMRQLTAEEVDLEEKMERLQELERMLQDKSFKVSNSREDKELLEKALNDIVKQQQESLESPRGMQRLAQQQSAVEKELSRVSKDLAESFKELEIITAESNKIEQEIALLKAKVHGELKRSKSAPSLATESTSSKVKMERDLAQVQNMMQGLSQKGEQLSQAMSKLRRSASGSHLPDTSDGENPKKSGTYMQTDIDSGEQIDLAQQIPLQSPDDMSAGLSRPLISHQRQDGTMGLGNTSADLESAQADWDISDADDNTKRFFGLLPKEKARGLTVRDVKRQSEQRREREKIKREDEDGQDITLRVSSTDSDTSRVIQARYPSYASSQTSSNLDLFSKDVRDLVPPSYNDLPRSDSMPALVNTGSAPNSNSSSRRSSISLLAPKPFTPYQDKTGPQFRSETVLNSALLPRNGLGSFVSDRTLNATGHSSRIIPGYSRVPFQKELLNNGQTSLTSSGVLRMGGSEDNLLDSHRQLQYSSVNQPPWYEPFRPGPTTQVSPKSYPPTFMSPAIHSSAAGDLILNAKMDDIPDIVKSSQTQIDHLDKIDHDMIEREILKMPDKVLIPERYDPEADAEHLTEVERQERLEKAERIKKLLTEQSILSMSQPDVSTIQPRLLHNQLLREKAKRAHILTLNQELARQVTAQSKKQAAARRKTWSGDQISDIKRQYEAELAANPDQFKSPTRTARQSNFVL